MTVYADLVSRHGLSSSHALLLGAVPDGASVVDAGCAEGYLAAALRERGCSVVGIEADPGAVTAARAACDAVVVGDIEDPIVRAELDGPFDRVLFGDVLEHLRDPEAVLRWARTLLGPDGRAVVSVPNIAHWTARRALLLGRFPQEDHGIFDRTHLRNFTRATARDLVERCGYAVEREQFTPAPLPLQERLPAMARLGPELLRRWPELFALQVVLTCRPA